MVSPKRMIKTALLAAPLGALALSLPAGSAEAADIVGTLQDQQQFSTLAKTMEAAGFTQSLQGEGPYTLFAPTDQAFAQLPQGALDELMKQENREQLKKLLQYHVIEGEEIMAEDVLGKQSDVDTASGDRLSVDGTGRMVMLVPTGLKVTRTGDQVYVEREVTAVTAPAVEVGPAGSDQQGQQQAQGQIGQQQAQAEQGGDMPSSPHQEQLLRGEQSGAQQTGEQVSTQQPHTEQGGDMPSSPHQEQLLRGEQGGEQQTGQQAGMAQAQAEQGGDMPSSPHQEQLLRGEQGGEQQRTARGGQQDQSILREATVVEPDIEADNGVIHAVDALLVPQSVLSMLEGASPSSAGEQSYVRPTADKRG